MWTSKHNFRLLFLSFFLTVTTTVLAEKAFVTDFYKNTGRFFDLKPYSSPPAPLYVHLLESTLFPAGGHIANEQLGKATMMGLLSVLPLPAAFVVLDEARKARNLTGIDPYGWSDPATFDLSRRYFYSSHLSQQLLFLATLSYLDAVFEAIVLYGRNEPDDTRWLIGATTTSMSFQSSATWADPLNPANPPSSNVSDQQLETVSPGFFLGVESGRVTAKRFLFDYGMQSLRLNFDWWFGVPLARYGLGETNFTRGFSPALGYRWFLYDGKKNDATTTQLNSSANQFNMYSGDFWVGFVWNSGLRHGAEARGVFSRVSAGAGALFLSTGTGWKHPTSLQAAGDGREGSAGIVKERAIRRQFLETVGTRAWVIVALWERFDFLAEFDWVTSQEQVTDFYPTPANVTYWNLQARLLAHF